MAEHPSKSSKVSKLTKISKPAAPAAKRGAEEDTSPSAILRAIEAQQSQRKGPEIRQHPRQFLCLPAVLEIQDSAAAPVRHASVATNNISEGGFGFIFDAHLRPGTLIRVCFESLPDKPTIRGEVRSSVRICGTQHRIGVEFTRPA